MKRNITRNRFRDQFCDFLRSGRVQSHRPADRGSADWHQGQLEDEKAVIKGRKLIESGLSHCRFSAISYTNYSDFKDCLPFVPLLKSSKLVRAYEQIKLAARIFVLKRLQRVNGVGWPRALHFTVVHDRTFELAEGQPSHRQPVLRGAERPGFVPGMAGRDDMQRNQVELLDCRPGQCDMGIVRRIKCATEDSNPPGFGYCPSPQSQSRLTKKSL